VHPGKTNRWSLFVDEQHVGVAERIVSLGSSPINSKSLLRKAFAVMGGDVSAMVKSITTVV
jgi:hypothetical protein